MRLQHCQSVNENRIEEGKAFLCDTTRPSWQETLTKWKSRAISPLLRILKTTHATIYGVPLRFTHRDFTIYLNQILLSCLFLLVKKSWNRDGIETGSIFLMYKGHKVDLVFNLSSLAKWQVPSMIFIGSRRTILQCPPSALNN